MGVLRRARAAAKGLGMEPGSGKCVKGQHELGDSNAGAVVEGGWARTGNDVSGAGAQDCAQFDGPPAKERVQVK